MFINCKITHVMPNYFNFLYNYDVHINIYIYTSNAIQYAQQGLLRSTCISYYIWRMSFVNENFACLY